jgi:thiazole synthase ThiGH ThiG subunit
MAFAGWGLLALLERRTVNARKVWTIVAACACIMSLGSPLGGGIGIGAKLGLASLHLIVGAVVIVGLHRTALSACERCN